jgi:RES domain-containing protein
VSITAYRISKAAYAAEMWSGHGARLYGGRWNSKGRDVVYAAENRALAALEQLVHLIPPRVLRGYVISSITFQEAQVRRVELRRLPARWNAPVPPAALRRIGDEWLESGVDPVLAVPSAVMPFEWNYLLNPRHVAFEKMARSGPVQFAYDERLR